MYDFLNNIYYKEDMQTIYFSRKTWNEFNRCSIYISGASGMIASYLCMFLIYLVEVHNYKIEIYAGIRNKEKAIEKFGLYCNKDYFHILSVDVSEPFNTKISFDYIIHAASLASPQYYGKYPVETVLPNVIGTTELLKYAQKNHITGMIFFSSDTIYGSVDNVSSINEQTIGSLDFLKMGNFYAESKRCGEMLCKAYYLEYDVPVKSVRIHHSYGPTLDIKNDTRVFAEFVGNIINNQDIVMKSAGTAKRAFCYMTDAIEGILKILLDGENGESYNMGNNQNYISIAELAQKLINLFPERNLKLLVKSRNNEGYVSGTFIRTVTADTTKLERLDWKPKVSVEKGFYRTVKAIELEQKMRDK